MTATERTAVRRERAVYLILGVVIAVVFVADCGVELGASVHLAYLAAIWLASLARRPSVVWITTGTSCVLLVLGYLLSPSAGRADDSSYSAAAEGAINHGFALVALLFSAAIAYRSCKAQRRIRAGERRFEAAVEASPAAFVMVDRKGDIVLANREFEVLFGYDRKEVLGQPIEILIPERFREEHPAHREEFFVASRKRATGVRGDFRALGKDGKEFPVVVGLNALEVDGDLFAVSTIVDVTEIVEARAQIDRQVVDLKRSNQELEQFAYIASHDLQEPLRKVSACCQALAEDYAKRLDEQGKEWIAFAVDGATRMRQLVADLLAFSRIGSRGKELAPTDANVACREAIANLAAAIEENSAEIRCDELPTVVADDVQLAQVFQNLIGNAIKYRGADPPRIDIGAEFVDGKARFHVRDNGIGIEPQFHKRIFGIFQRLHGKDQYSGTGIGLAICKKAVQRMGGDIWVDSSAGAGSTFYFTLALAPRAVDDLSPSRTDGGTIAATTIPAGRIHATHRDTTRRR